MELFDVSVNASVLSVEASLFTAAAAVVVALAGASFLDSSSVSVFFAPFDFSLFIPPLLLFFTCFVSIAVVAALVILIDGANKAVSVSLAGGDAAFIFVILADADVCRPFSSFLLELVAAAAALIRLLVRRVVGELTMVPVWLDWRRLLLLAARTRLLVFCHCPRENLQ